MKKNEVIDRKLWDEVIKMGFTTLGNLFKDYKFGERRYKFELFTFIYKVEASTMERSNAGSINTRNKA